MFHKLEQKLRYIESHRARPIVDDLAAAIGRNLCQQLPTIAPGTVAGVQADAVYGLLRHLPWIMVTTYQEVLSDFLARQHGLTRGVVESTVSLAVDRLRSILDIRASGEGADQDFLRYLVVTTLVSGDSEDLVTELGLGEGLINRIFLVNEAVRRGDAIHETAVTYGGTADAMLSDIIQELQEASLADSTHISILRLRYLTRDASQEFSALTNLESLRGIYRLLLHVARAQLVESKSLSETIPEMLPQFAAQFTANQVLAQLSALSLMFRSARTRNGKMEKWSLTPLGLDIVADELADEWLRQHDDAFAKLSEQSSSVQRAIIRNLQRTQPNALPGMLQNQGIVLSKEALLELLEAIRSILPEHQLLGMLFELVRASRRPWVRSTICRTVRKLPPSAGASRVLREIVKSESSSQVRDLALSSLMDLSAREAAATN